MEASAIAGSRQAGQVGAGAVVCRHREIAGQLVDVVVTRHAGILAGFDTAVNGVGHARWST